MRLWSLHPKYLDTKGLLALWREGLLAKKVLEGGTRGYKNHPQLARFRAFLSPVTAINAYLCYVLAEARARGYAFNGDKIVHCTVTEKIPVTEDQVAYERAHLLGKLTVRDPRRAEVLASESVCDVHPIFSLIAGPVADWERV